MRYITLTVFETIDDYCTFVSVLAKQGYKRLKSSWQSADVIRKYIPNSRDKLTGYAVPYDGTFGKGWKVYMHNFSSEHSGNNRVSYYIKEDDDE